MSRPWTLTGGGWATRVAPWIPPGAPRPPRPLLARRQLLLLSLPGPRPQASRGKPPTTLSASGGDCCAQGAATQKPHSAGPLPGPGFPGFSLASRTQATRAPPARERGLLRASERAQDLSGASAGGGGAAAATEPRGPSPPSLSWPRGPARAPLPGPAGGPGAADAGLPRRDQPSSRRPMIESRLSFSLSDMAAPPLQPSSSGPAPASRPPAASFRPGSPSARPSPPPARGPASGPPGPAPPGPPRSSAPAGREAPRPGGRGLGGGLGAGSVGGASNWLRPRGGAQPGSEDVGPEGLWKLFFSFKSRTAVPTPALGGGCCEHINNRLLGTEG